MGTNSCHYSSSGNGSSSCSSYSMSDIQLSIGAIIAIVVGSLVTILLITIVIILILRCLLCKPPVIPLHQQPYLVNNQQPWPQTHRTHTSESPPPYSEVFENNK